MKKIYPCLWFDRQAEDAAKFYQTVFAKTKIGETAHYSEPGAKVASMPPGSLMTIEFQLEDLAFLGLNGGPLFKFTPALSFFVSCNSEEEITETWRELSAGGKTRMGLDKYPWAEKYGWTADKFGVEWQLILSPRPHKVVPAFLFVDKLFGRGQEAIDLYTKIFPHSKIETMTRDEAGKTIMHCSFTLENQGFVLMEGRGEHGHTFNQSTSLVVNCDTQKEIDHYWNALSAGGSEDQCGWLRDKFGVSWQIVPSGLGKLMSDPARAGRVMQAMLKMKKLDMAGLNNA
jgi:predicted 3-demethylubiquinone-9 3-methyltransferase (glyoxalase superfamily)